MAKLALITWGVQNMPRIVAACGDAGKSCDSGPVASAQSMQRDAQVGALAVDGHGAHFLVNGEFVAPLNKRFIAKAVSAARSHVPLRHEKVRQRTASPPVVTVRRSRTAVSALQRDPGTAGGD